MISALTTLQQWLLFTSAILLVGCIGWRLRVFGAAAGAAVTAGPEESTEVEAMSARVASLARKALAVLFVAWILRLVVQVMAFRDPFVPLSEDVSFLLFEIEWGTVWMVQGGVVVALGLVMLLGARRQVGWSLAALLGVALATTMAFSGHASGVDSWRALALTADAVHTLAAGLWMGTLAVILTAGRTPDLPRPHLFAAQIQSFSPMALVSGMTLVAMGAFLSWTHLTAVSDLWTLNYGRLLSAKVALAGGIFGLGFWNWRRGIPSLDTEEGAAEVRRRATFEVAMAVGVVCVTAVLVHSAKP